MALNIPLEIRLSKLQNWIEEELIKDPKLMTVDNAYKHYEYILSNTKTMFELGLRSKNNDYILYARNLLKSIKTEMFIIMTELENNERLLKLPIPEPIVEEKIIKNSMLATWLYNFFNKHKTKKTVQAAIKGYTQSIDVYLTVSKCYDEMISLDINSITSLLETKDSRIIADLQTLL